MKFDEEALDQPLGYFCPECATGKHQNCDGVAGMGDLDEELLCNCKVAEHPRRRVGVKEDQSVSEDGLWALSQRIDINTRQILENEWIARPAYPAVMVDPMYNIDAPGVESGLVPNSADVELPPPAPENDPGVSATSFPELTPEADEGDWQSNYRIKPDREILRDLMDVEILNEYGVWVPAVPLPIFRWFGVCQCHCGKRRLGKKRYQEHYAYAHILGMES